MDDAQVVGVEPDISLEVFRGRLAEQHSPALSDADRIYQYAVQRRVSPAYLLAQFEHESSSGRAGTAVTTKSWGNTRLPNFGIDYDTPSVAGRSGSFPVFRSWYDGAVTTIERLLQYAPYHGKVTVRQIIPTWAPGDDGNDVNGYANAVLRRMADLRGRAAQPQPGGTTMARIALAAGHHNKDGGNDYEKEQTGQLCRAVGLACQAHGMDVRYFTPDEGMGYRSDGIWDVAHDVVNAAQAGWVPDIFLECHTEGAGVGARGVFAIYPDWGGDVDTDVRDRLGPLVTQRIASAVGGPIRGDGLMSEARTGVGLSGYRLGIFGQSAAIAGTTTRLIIEYFSHDDPDDLALARRSDFYDLCGQATAQSFAEFLGLAEPQPGPTPPVAPPIDDVPHGPTEIVTSWTAPTGFTVSGRLLQYWAGNAQPLVVFGYPIGEQHAEKLEDGKVYQVQYFERARLELHPENPEPFTVQAGRLGVEILKLRKPEAA